MEVFFVDVGFGTCQVILIGQRRAIVIDCGVASDHIALQFLKRQGIQTIECLITSHSDNDHSGGAISILNDYSQNIGQVFVISDHKFLKSSYWRRIDFLVNEGVLQGEQICNLVIDKGPRLLWSDTNSQLRCFSPSYIENLQAQDRRNANSSSAILVLDHFDKRIVFAADSIIEQWKKIHKKRSNQTLVCDMLAVPHHGGLCDEQPGDLDWLYDHALEAEFAVLSVGTVKTPKHPRPQVISKLRSKGTKILCTEITKQCHVDPNSLKPGVLNPQVHMGRAMDQPNSQWTACAGTVRAEVTGHGIEIERLYEHQKSVDSLAADSVSGICPLCRRT